MQDATWSYHPCPPSPTATLLLSQAHQPGPSQAPDLVSSERFSPSLTPRRTGPQVLPMGLWDFVFPRKYNRLGGCITKLGVAFIFFFLHIYTFRFFYQDHILLSESHPSKPFYSMKEIVIHVTNSHYRDTSR